MKLNLRLDLADGDTILTVKKEVGEDRMYGCLCVESATGDRVSVAMSTLDHAKVVERAVAEILDWILEGERARARIGCEPRPPWWEGEDPRQDDLGVPELGRRKGDRDAVASGFRSKVFHSPADRTGGGREDE